MGIVPMQRLYDNLPEPTTKPGYLSKSILNDIQAKVPSLPFVKTGYVDESICNAIIARFHEADAFARSYQGVVDKKIRHCMSAPLNDCDFGVLENFIQQQMSPFLGCTFKAGFSVNPLVNAYPVGVGMAPHHDMVTDIELKRAETNNQPVMGGDYTIILLLNDLPKNAGGEVHFPDYALKVPCIKGTCIAFRVDVVHEVLSIVKGVRYSVVARVFVD